MDWFLIFLCLVILIYLFKTRNILGTIISTKGIFECFSSSLFPSQYCIGSLAIFSIEANHHLIISGTKDNPAIGESAVIKWIKLIKILLFNNILFYIKKTLFQESSYAFLIWYLKLIFFSFLNHLTFDASELRI